ncbi:MAG: histidine kinase N-terminal 7TM domain-containing protein, partial [Thiolinea sp.]
MYEATLLIFTAAIIASCYLCRDAYKHRFLPIAQPLMYFSFMLVLVCSVSLIEIVLADPPLWLAQAVYDVRRFVVRPLAVPLWAWVLLEYHYDKKIPFTNKVILLCFLLPLMAVVLYAISLFTDGFISHTSSVVISSEVRSNGLMWTLRLFGGVMAIFIMLLTPFLVKKRRQSKHPLLEALLVILLTAIPFLLWQLHQRGYTSVAFAAPAMTMLLLWGNRQYRLLDALPLALNGIMDKVNAGVLVSNVHSKLLYINSYA